MSQPCSYLGARPTTTHLRSGIRRVLLAPLGTRFPVFVLCVNVASHSRRHGAGLSCAVAVHASRPPWALQHSLQVLSPSHAQANIADESRVLLRLRLWFHCRISQN